jgi:prevent-host-death family protein
MRKGVPIGEAKTRLSSLVNAVAYGGERVVIESRGRPKAALVSVEDLERLRGVRPGRPSKSQRRLALAQAAGVRKALEGFRLTEALKDLHRLRGERLHARG